MTDQRFPTDVRLIGVMLKGRSKMFMTSVLWSDHSEVIVYRRFQDFRTLHKILKRKFAPENRFRTSDRILPRFRAKTVKQSFQRKGPNKSVLRLKFLEKYCTELLACDPSVTQCSELIQFFLPQSQDLEPDYTKNSIVIVPSEDLPEGQDRTASYTEHKRHSSGNISQPFVAETYRCIATYETKDTKNKAFTVAVGETVEVLIKDKTGWWLVENEEKRLAWFPAPFLERCDDDEVDENDDDDDEIESSLEGRLYCAVRCYRSTKEDEVSVNIGSVVEVLQKTDSGWWLIRYNGKAGYVPSMYLQPYANPHMRLWALQKDVRRSSLCLATPCFAPGDEPTPTYRQRSRSMDLLSEKPLEVKGHRGSLSESSEGSDFSFSDEFSSSGSNSLNASQSDAEEPAEVSVHTGDSTVSVHSGDSTVSVHSGPCAPSTTFAPKVPPRPRAQEIFTRCTTITRKAARVYKTNLFLEDGPKQIR